MKSVKNLITAVVFGVVVAICAAAAFAVWRNGIPHQAHWAVPRIAGENYAGMPIEEKLRVARHLEDDFSRGMTLKNEVALLPPAARERFPENFDDLSVLWLIHKADQYDQQLEERQRRKDLGWIERRSGRINGWLRQSLEYSSQSDEHVTMQQLNKLYERSRAYHNRLPKPERDKLKRFVMAVVEQKLAAAGMQGLRPGL